MNLNLEQMKIIHTRQTGHMLVRGVAGSGKTTVAIHRAEYLLNQYCMDEKDKVLLVTYNRTLVKYLGYLHAKVSSDSKQTYGLFGNDKSKVEIATIDSMIYGMYQRLYKGDSEGLKLCYSEEQGVALRKCIVEVKKLYSDVGAIDLANFSFLRNEIDWIKACNYMELTEYQNADRHGRQSSSGAEGPQRLLKNSRVREAIYQLMLAYDSALAAEGMMDHESMALKVLATLKDSPRPTYTHIIIDESQDLSRVQLEILLSLYRSTDYSTIGFFADIAQSIYPQSWLVRGRSFTSIGLDMTGKSSNLSKNYRTTTQISQAAYSLLEDDPDIVQEENFVKAGLVDKQGRFPVLRMLNSPRQEAEYVIGQVKELLGQYSPRDIVIIARLHSQLEEMNEHLTAAGLACEHLKTRESDFDKDCVKLVTIHSVKGLEFPVVFIIGLNDGVMPFLAYKDPTDQELQELVEKKILYVGMTRASELLFLSSSGVPSKFLRAIKPEYLRLEPASRLGVYYPVSINDYLFKDAIVDMYRKEERVRQWLLRELIDKYKYPVSLLEVEYKVNNFSKMGSVDICVSIYRKDNRVPYIFVEVKALGNGVAEGANQLKSYMSANKMCQYGVVTDGNELLVLDSEFKPIADIPAFDHTMLPSSLEQWRYLCLRSNRELKLFRDVDIKAELAVEYSNETTRYTEEALRLLSSYEGIAAGQPIFMQGKSEAEFWLPQEWLLGMEDCYLLKVQGDSMIGADIRDGDHVLVRSQAVANNWDIVAVTIDDEATLKRFSRMGDSVLLIPENKEYEPIQLQDNQARIVGVVIGIMKREYGG